MTTEENTCPKCGSRNLDYGAQDMRESAVYYPFTCNDCGVKGKEWFTLNYSESIIDDY